MKRGGRLQRRTPLRPGKPPKSTGKGPGRKPLPRGRGPRPKPADTVAWAAWQEQRRRVFARSGGWCERCGRSLHHGFEAHHRKLRSRMGADDVTNLVALCTSCHEWAHGHPEHATALGFIVPAASDPASRPLRLPDGRWVRLTDDDAYDLCFQDGEPA